MQYTWQLALVARACIFHKALGLMLYLLHTSYKPNLQKIHFMPQLKLQLPIQACIVTKLNGTVL